MQMHSTPKIALFFLYIRRQFRFLSVSPIFASLMADVSQPAADGNFDDIYRRISNLASMEPCPEDIVVGNTGKEINSKLNGSLLMIGDPKCGGAVSGQENAHCGVVPEEYACDSVLAVSKMRGPENQEPIFKKPEEGQVVYPEKCSLKIQVIDDSVLIEPSLIGNGKFNNDRDYVKRNTKPQETDRRKEKKPKRRGGKPRINKCAINCNSVEKKEKKGLVYSRKEMEAMRFEELEDQKKKWVEVYCGLCPMVAREYDELVHSDNHHQNSIGVASFDFDPRHQFQKVSTFPASLGEDCFQLPDNNIEPLNPSNPTSCLPVIIETGCSVVDEEYSPDNSSDEDYSSIQKPAFLVTGQPDFDSGPPQDGLEYLRRVRWEASKIPKVTVAKVEKGKSKKEQTLYMPQLPDIAKCPEYLMPVKHWEDCFLADFSELRLFLSQLDLQGSSAKDSVNMQLLQEAAFLGQMSESVIFENFENSSPRDFSFPSEASCSILETSVDSPEPEKSSLTSDCPTLSSVLKMDSAARTLTLRRRISAIENTTTLTRNDCLWLFSLCAAVDCPLDADTSAALRSLLRKCSILRAAKEKLDDEVIILNILATISGRYFGQLEK